MRGESAQQQPARKLLAQYLRAEQLHAACVNFPTQIANAAPRFDEQAIDSAEYARAFAEVKEVGGFDSRTRTADHTHLAMWWKEFVESSHNRLARELVASDRLELRRAARLFALLTW